MKQYPHAFRGAIFALLGGIFWGFSANCAQVLMIDYGVTAQWLTCARMFCSAIFMLTVVFLTQRDRFIVLLKDRKAFLLTLTFACVGVVMVQFSYLECIRLTGAGIALLLQQLGLVLIMFYVCFRAKRLPMKREYLGVIFALIGVILISTQGNITSLSIPFIGLFWGLVSAVALGAYNIIPEYPLSQCGGFVVVGVAMFFGTLLGCVLFQPWQYDVNLDFYGYAVLVGVVVIGTIAAYLLYMQGVKETGPMRASLIGCVEPVSGMIISAVWLKAPISMFDIAGAVFIVVMIFLVTERDTKESH